MKAKFTDGLDWSELEWFTLRIYGAPYELELRDVKGTSRSDSSDKRTAAMRSTSNRLLRMKQASASSILQAVNGARDHRRERERGENTVRRELSFFLTRKRTKDERTTIEQQKHQHVIQVAAVYRWDSRRQGGTAFHFFFFPMTKWAGGAVFSEARG